MNLKAKINKLIQKLTGRTSGFCRRDLFTSSIRKVSPVPGMRNQSSIYITDRINHRKWASERSERVFRYWDKTGNESINRVLTFDEMIQIARAQTYYVLRTDVKRTETIRIKLKNRLEYRPSLDSALTCTFLAEKRGGPRAPFSNSGWQSSLTEITTASKQ